MRKQVIFNSKQENSVWQNKIENNKFYGHKSPILKKDLDIEKVLVSSKVSSGVKTINTLLVNDLKVKPLHIMLPKISAFIKIIDRQKKWMYFLIEYDDLLQEYNTLWEEFRADIEKEFDRKPVCNKNFLKTKINSHGNKITDFNDKKFRRQNLIILVQQ